MKKGLKKISREDAGNFRRRVLAAVSKIPKGKTMTYAQVARKAGNPGAARAIGSMMRKNFDPNVPCHRVIRSDGKIGDYNRGGMAQKRKLLINESAIVG